MRGRTARNSSETCAELVGDLRGHFQKIPENSREFQKNPHCAQLMLRHFLPARNSSETCADTSRKFQKIPEKSRKIRIARNSCSAIFSREANWFELICPGSMSCAQVSRSFKSFRLVLKPTHFVLNVFWFLFWFLVLVLVFFFCFFVFLSVFFFFSFCFFLILSFLI